MVEIVLEIDVSCDAHTDETTRTCWVNEGLHLVGCADERGIATELLDGLAVRRAELHIARRQKILQDNLLRAGSLVELVDIDERKRSKGDVKVELVLEVDLVVVVVAQFWWQQNLAETCLPAALTANQKWR